jgi:hypothetical protein
MYIWLGERICYSSWDCSITVPYLYKQRLDLWLILFVTKTSTAVQDKHYQFKDEAQTAIFKDPVRTAL